jgi:subtilisin family serine protease
MKQEYVVLRVPGSMRGGRKGLLSVAAARQGAADVRAETQLLSGRELSDVHRDPETIAAAPKMPIALVRPVICAADDAAASDEPDTGPVAWGLHSTKAADSPYTGKGVVVAVLDTGIDLEHAAFSSNPGRIVQKDFTGEGDGDQNGHGTHCAGTIFGDDVTGVRIGIARGIRQALIGKVLDRRGGGDTAQLLDGILWASRAGANVISMSLAFDFPGMVDRLMQSDGLKREPATSMTLASYRENVRLFDTLASLVAAQSQMFSKCIIVAAAGNESARPDYEIITAPPAAADGILSVGAIDRKSRVAPFSNAMPDVAAPGVDIRSAAAGGGLASMNGTSMATPHVAGIAALWLEKVMTSNPAFKANEVMGKLLGNASSDEIAAADRANVGSGCVVAPR